MAMKTPGKNKDRFVIIMAGGRGERFWPVSRENTPKQLIKLLGDKSFLQETVERVLPLVPIKNVFIITNEAQAAEVRRQLPKLPKDNVVAEPMGRDTCAAVTLGAALVGARSTTGVMAVLPATHMVDLGAVRQQLGRDVGLATESELAGLFMDCEPGAIPPLGQAYGVEAIIDESLARAEDIYFEAGDHCALVHVSGKDFLKLMGNAPFGQISRHHH